jgi:hypothetical protein
VQAEATSGTGFVSNFAPEMLRISPTFIVSFGVTDEGVMPGQGSVRYHGRNVEKSRSEQS